MKNKYPKWDKLKKKKKGSYSEPDRACRALALSCLGDNGS